MTPEKIRIQIGGHFRQRFNTRFKNIPNLVEYLNEKFNKGYVGKDPEFKGIYFPTAGAYVPLIKNQYSENEVDYMAKTFQFKTITSLFGWKQKYKKVEWFEHKKSDIK